MPNKTKQAPPSVIIMPICEPHLAYVQRHPHHFQTARAFASWLFHEVEAPGGYAQIGNMNTQVFTEKALVTYMRDDAFTCFDFVDDDNLAGVPVKFRAMLTF